MWEERLAETKHGKDIDAIRFLELLIRNILEVFVGPLKGGIVHKDVDRSKRMYRFPGYILAYGMLANIARKQEGLAACFGYETLGLTASVSSDR